MIDKNTNPVYRGIERRKHRRVKAILPIKIIYEGEELLAKTEDISSLGTCVESDKKIPIESVVNIILKIPGLGEIKCEGTIIRCDYLAGNKPTGSYILGVFFRKFLNEGEENLSKYIENSFSQDKQRWKKLFEEREEKIFKKLKGIKEAEFKVKYSKKIYNGDVISLSYDKIVFPNGKKFSSEILHHPVSVGVVPILGRKNVILIQRFRYTVKGFLFEIPSGTLEKSETLKGCAIRKLEEETGYKPKNIEKLISIYPTPGISNEIIHIFKATGLSKIKQKLKMDELLKVKIIYLKDAIELIEKGEINDAKTIIGLLSIQK